MNAKALQGMIDKGDLKGLMEVTRKVAEGKVAVNGVRSPQDAAALVMDEMSTYVQEVFTVLLLDTRNKLIEKIELYKGTLNANTVRIGEVFRHAIVKNAAAIIIAHNHPSGDPSPSPEDIAVTKEITQAGDLLDIDLLDHIVIGKGRFVSLRAQGLMQSGRTLYEHKA